MTEFLILATSSDVWTNEKGEKYDCRYIIVKKPDNVKPQIYKASADALKTASNLRGKKCYLAFDERQRINGLTEIKTEN